MKDDDIREMYNGLKDELRSGFASLAVRIDDTNSRLDETNARLDETNARLDETKKELGARIDNLSGR